MDFLTIAGYIFAALAIALGLYLMLRKNATNENTTTATEQVALADNDHHITTDLNNGRIPVVPRHRREQLSRPAQAAAPQDQPGINQPAVTTGRDQDTLDTSSLDADNDLLANLPDIKAERTAGLLDQTLTDEHADQRRQDEAASSPMLAQQTQAQIQALAESSKPDQDPVEDTFDQVLAQLEAATSADAADVVNPEQIQDVPAKADTDTLTTAAVEEWQGESALLDAHLQDQERRDDESALAQAEHIVALYVMPNPARTLSGERTIQLLRQFGLRYGEMSLFHRFADSDGTGPLMFSVLRYTSEGPSGFDLETLPAEQVEGLAFFLALPSKHAVAGYDTMVSISTLLAREIHGQVYDEHMNQLSPQLREHYRHFVLEYRQPA